MADTTENETSISNVTTAEKQPISMVSGKSMLKGINSEKLSEHPKQQQLTTQTFRLPGIIHSDVINVTLSEKTIQFS